MMRAFPLLLFALFPLGAEAAPPHATLAVGNTLLVASSTPANLYLLGTSVAITAPTAGDLSVIGGSVVNDARVGGDALFVGGSIHVKAPVAGDLRAVGGRVSISAPTGNDLVVISGSVLDEGGGAKSTFIAAPTVKLLAGENGPVTLYVNDVTLGGIFNGDIFITAGNRITLLPNTVIHGALDYQAPQEATIPSSAVIDGGAHYTGASYLPTEEEAQAIALASFGVFLFVKILGALILAGLIAGLFPLLSMRMAARAMTGSVRQALLTLLLGFGVVVATPVLFLLLTVTFVGFGIALLIGAAYLIAAILAFVFSGIILGAFLAKLLFKRTSLRWSDAVFGTLVLFVLWYIPVIGWLIVALLSTYSLGALSLFFYRFAFPNLKEVEEYGT